VASLGFFIKLLFSSNTRTRIRGILLMGALLAQDVEDIGKGETGGEDHAASKSKENGF